MLTTNAAINQFVSDVIAGAGSSMLSVKALTKNGEVKTFVFSPANNIARIAKLVTAAGAKAAETRARNNPNLINVHDLVKFNKLAKEAGFPVVRRRKGETLDSFEARKEARRIATAPLVPKCWRCFSLDNVLSLTSKGHTFDVRLYRGGNSN